MNANIEDVELVHGALSTLYGSQAMGGVVNIITKKPPAEGVETSFLSTFGTFRSYKEKVVHGARIGKFGYILNGGWEQSQGHRHNANYYAKDFNAKFDYKLNDDHEFLIDCGFYRSDKGTPGPIETPGIMQGYSRDYLENTKKAAGFDRFGKPEEIASMVTFLASDEANFISGQNIPVCGIKNLGY